jgi:hypothetical protein
VTRSLLLAAMLLLPTLCAAQPVTITTKDTIGNVVVPGQTITVELPEHVHPIPSETPTAEELSEPGALDRYVEARVKQGLTVKLPPGKITGNLWIDDDSTIVEGAGDPYMRRVTGTVIVPADSAKPAVTVRNACKVKLRNFGILGAEVGVSLEGSNGSLVLHTSLKDVAISGADVGVRVSELPGTRKNQNAAADVTIDHCTFNDCNRAIELNHPQSVNVHVTGQSYFYKTDTAVWINYGGRVLIADSCCNGLGAWLVLKKGGGNLVPCVLRNLYSDRTGGAAPPIIVDARGCTDRVRVLVDVYSCPFLTADGKWAEVTHRHFYPPDGSKDAAANSVIKIADWDFFNAAGSLEGVTP